ncbi:hypothetical protein RJZ56_002966 [Blastomyces dermatitidis]|uniref:Uncharacterized protein n=3 Tax=Blastomyces TaxID=229219 RepID=A0A179UHD9_BLAGS|nr:uncharacterized protein BDBG_03259 [Blastomyces gilchristii SLH14081]XP_045278773.1 uncharacterized protein BDCG_07572 [Blastomyces dermatitidis ER-3]EGE84015.1 hypothetical protein BDDG_06960 [Blastomyces dermatitidis ATCC 18188]EQL35156.1 hypothetical protein BDFG_03140 [Blastomyces dermatitidis ATCC 26199]EEQ92452.1 hypothetical protein BDCG_07572 [Blastomyces dermatitidis ER-3]OAT07163.1 hypothetical protein BDBG_03259 [Blastomyces gilchristii SLH14081]
MTEKKVFLDAADFQKGLSALDTELGKNAFIVAFAPIKIIAAGGYFAITYLKNRTATTDLDYIADPQWAADEEIKKPIQEAIFEVSTALNYNEEWINEDMALFVAGRTRQQLFEQAERQNIVLFKGENLTVLAAPVEWVLERKIRRIHTGDRGRKAELDMSDALALLKYMKDRKGELLDKEHIRTLNSNSFDIIPTRETMEQVAAAFWRKYRGNIFA